MALCMVIMATSKMGPTTSGMELTNKNVPLGNFIVVEDDGDEVQRSSTRIFGHYGVQLPSSRLTGLDTVNEQMLPPNIGLEICEFLCCLLDQFNS